MGSSLPDYEYLLENPYDSFMRKHLQHYGYYTGRNELFRRKYSSNSIEGLEDMEYVNAALEGEERSDMSDKLFDTTYLKTNQLTSNDCTGKLQLKTPRDLFAGSGPSTLQEPKWPIEMEVLPNKVHHIDTSPELEKVEPFYEPSGFEQTPMARGEDAPTSRVVFAYEPAFNPFFIRSRVGGSRLGCSEVNVAPISTDDNTLQFESRFESGNLEKAIQVGPFEYELYLRPDLYTTKHVQWYYFRVENMRVNRVYRFTIVNFYKSQSLYNEGMRPLMYSENAAKLQSVGWRRWGNSIKYYRNNLKYNNSRGEFNHYSLTWCCSFPHESDTVYFAHCYPYSYTDLQRYLHAVIEDPLKSHYCKLRVLCNSLAGNNVYVLNITEPITNDEEDSLKRERYKQRKLVIVTARVHPGESNASWMMKGLLDHLLSSSPDAKVLREHFYFKIVPMLNPDGVIVGNYRCGLAGRDLNRNYKTMLKDSFPTVWSARNMIEKLVEDNRHIVLYCDLHGHSRKNNVFIYGCDNKESSDLRFQEQIFPAMMAKNAPSKFAFNSCRFSVQKSKEGTGRVVMWRLGITNSFTMEATFCGSTLGDRNKTHFCQKDLESMGYHLCDTLLDYSDPDPIKTRVIVSEIEHMKKQELLRKLQSRGMELDPSNITLSDLAALSGEDKGDSSSDDGDGSDSSDSDGLPVHYEYLKKQMEGKQKQRKSLRDRNSQRTFDKALAANCKQKRSESANSKLCQNLDSTAPSVSLSPLLHTPLAKQKPFLRRPPLSRHETSPISAMSPTQPNTVSLSLSGQDPLPRVMEAMPSSTKTQRGDSQMPFRCPINKPADRPYQVIANRTYLKYSGVSRVPLQPQKVKNFAIPDERSESRLLQTQSDSSKEYICPHHQRQLKPGGESDCTQDDCTDTELTLESLVLAKPALSRTSSSGIIREDEWRKEVIPSKNSMATSPDYNLVQDVFRIESLPIRQLSAKRELIKESRQTQQTYFNGGRKKSLVSPQLGSNLTTQPAQQDSSNVMDTTLEQEVTTNRQIEEWRPREETIQQNRETFFMTPEVENSSAPSHHAHNTSLADTQNSTHEQIQPSHSTKSAKSVAFAPNLSYTSTGATQPLISSLPIASLNHQSSSYQLEEVTKITPSPFTRSKTFHSSSTNSVSSMGAAIVKTKPSSGKSVPLTRAYNSNDYFSTSVKANGSSVDQPRRCYLNGMDSSYNPTNTTQSHQQYNSPTKVVLVMSGNKSQQARGDRPLPRRSQQIDSIPNLRRG